MSRKLTALLGALAIAAVPAAVAQAHGKAGQHGKAHSHKAHKHPVAYRVKGVVTAIDATTNVITVHVGDTRGATNRPARDWRNQDVQFDVSNARITDSNGDGERNLADLAVGNQVKVLAKLLRGAAADGGPYAAKKVVVRHPEPAEGTEGTEGTETETESTPTA